MQPANQEWPPRIAPLRGFLMAHLNRVEWFSIGSLLLGLALPLVVQTRGVLMFGLVTAGWSTVNILFAVLGRKAPPPRSVGRFVQILVANQMSNALYVLFGVMFGLSSSEVDWQAAGWAICIQGNVLMVFDGILLRQTRRFVESQRE